MLVRNKRPPDFKKAPQLVVAPVALLAQWKQEIEDKTTTNLKVLIHHGGSRAKTPAQLKQYDVVITTWGIVRSESKIGVSLVATAISAERYRKRRRTTRNRVRLHASATATLSTSQMTIMNARSRRVRCTAPSGLGSSLTRLTR